VESYVHHLPGRLRVRLERAKNPIVASSLGDMLRTMQGVSSVHVNATTGSVLIHYSVAETDAATPRLIMRTSNLTAPHSRVRPRMQHPPARLVVRVRRRIARAAFDYLLERAFERATILLLAAIF
jgi:hypothetical protein